MNNVNNIFKLTDLQKAYYLGNMGIAYLGNIIADGAILLAIKGLNITRLEDAINQVVLRHEMLRASLYDETQGIIHDNVPFINVAIAEDVNDIEAFYVNMRNSSFDISKLPTFKFVAVKSATSSDFNFLFFHYCLFFLDVGGWVQFIQEVISIYQKDNFEEINNSDNLRFTNFTNSIGECKGADQWKNDLEYWNNKNLTSGRPSFPKINILEAKIDKPSFASIRREISPKNHALIKKQCRAIGITPTIFYLAIYSITLMRWANTSEIVINVISSYKNRYKGIIGNYGNPIPLLIELPQQLATAQEFLVKVAKQLKEDLKHTQCSILDIASKYFERYAPLFPCVFTPALSAQECLGLKLLEKDSKLIKHITKTAQVWIDNQVGLCDDACTVKWDYVEQLFDYATIKSMHDHYCWLIEGLAELDWVNDRLPQFHLPLQDLNIIKNINSSFQKLPEDTLFGYYEKFIANNSLEANIAVVDNKDGHQKEYTYQQLLDESKLLAGHIYELSINQKGQLIAVLSEKGYNQVVATLAIMKAGLGYLPLNIEWPVGRITDILVEGQVHYVLLSKAQASNQHLIAQLSNYKLLIIEDCLKVALASARSNRLLPPVMAEDIAYVIFTSGSTGKPKGVTISHQGALNTIIAVNNEYSISQKDKILALSELSFDLSVYDIFGILAVGGAIVFPEQGQIKNPGHWVDLINQQNITIWNTVPQLANLLIDEVFISQKKINCLRLFLLSGDWIPLDLPHKLNGIENIKVISLGGATEGSIWSIWYEIKQVISDWNTIPYGIAMPNQKMYVLNIENGHCPIGVLGEICIGGVGLALDYWMDKEKTNNSFFIHPSLGRLYKTGDLGKYSIDGYIEFHGRKDSQLKINGYRIELGEIEHRLSQIPGVKQAVVIPQEHKQRNYLIAYLLPKFSGINLLYDDAKFNAEEFKLNMSGIRKDLQGASYQLDIKQEQLKYRTRKSYRKYKSTAIDTDLLNKQMGLAKSFASSHLLSIPHQSNSLSCPVHLTLRNLEYLLNMVSGHKFEGKMLPKYLYPSAGHSYCVRSYISISKNNTDIGLGYYYYHPLEFNLYKVNIWDMLVKEPDKEQWDASIDLIVYWPSIRPLYHNHAEKFAYIEAGHILNLFIHQLKSLNLAFKIKPTRQNLDNDNTLLAKLLIGTNQLEESSSDLASEVQEYLYTHIDSGVYRGFNKDVDLSALSIFEQVDSYSGRILESAGGLITLEGKTNPNSLIYMGLYCQELADQLYQYNYGSCMLGYKLYDEVVYSMAVGEIDEEQKTALEDNIGSAELKGYIEKHLNNHLPEYMLPYVYITLSTLPLSSNGKVDISKLPRPKTLEEQREYIAPRTELEQQLCIMFAKVLNLDVGTIGVYDNFFKLGGNSLLAMQLVSLINGKLSVNVNLSDIYLLSNVENIVSKKLSDGIAINKVQIEEEF